MKTSIYSNLKNKITELNNLQDQISLIEWNNDDGPNFNSVEEMKDFISRCEKNEFDYLFDEKDVFKHESKNNIIEDYKYTLDNFFFYIYTYQRKDKFITFLSLQNLDEKDILNNLCGKEDPDVESAHTHFENLKTTITTNNIDDILDNLIIGAEKNIEILKNKLETLTSES